MSLSAIATSRRIEAVVGSMTEAAGYRLLIVPALLLLLGAFVYPLSGLVLQSFRSPDGALGYYVRLLTDEYSLFYLKNTIVFAAVTALGTAVLGYPLAILLASVRQSVAAILLLLVLVPFWTSILVRSYAWMVILGRRGLLNTTLIHAGIIEQPLALMFNSTGVLVGMIHIMLPYMVLMLFSVLVRINRDLLLAGESLGAPPRQVFRRVVLPLTMPGLFGGFVLVFAMSLGFFVTPALMGGRRDVVAAMEIRELITRKLEFDEAAAVAMLLLLLKVGTLLVCARIFGLKQQMSWGRHT